MLTKKYFNVNFWKGISCCYIMVFIVLNPGTPIASFYNEYQGIIGISVLHHNVPNQQQLSGIYSCLGEIVNLYISL